jgi:hypothetical protein
MQATLSESATDFAIQIGRSPPRDVARTSLGVDFRPRKLSHARLPLA